MKSTSQLLVFSVLVSAMYAGSMDSRWREELCHACNGTVLYTNDTFFCVMNTKDEMACVNWEVASLKGVDLRPLLADGSTGTAGRMAGKRSPRNGETQDFPGHVPNYQTINPERDMRNRLDNRRLQSGMATGPSLNVPGRMPEDIFESGMSSEPMLNVPERISDDRREPSHSLLNLPMPGRYPGNEHWNPNHHQSARRLYDDAERDRNVPWIERRREPWIEEAVPKSLGREAGLHEVRLGGPLGGDGFQARTQYARGENTWNPLSLWPDPPPRHDVPRGHDVYRTAGEPRYNSRYMGERPEDTYHPPGRGYVDREDSRGYQENNPMKTHQSCVDNVLQFLMQNGLLEDEKRKEAARVLLEREGPERARMLAHTLQQSQQPDPEDSPRQVTQSVMPADASSIAEQIAASVARAAERLFPLPDTRSDSTKLQAGKAPERASRLEVRQASPVVRQVLKDVRPPDFVEQKRTNEIEPNRPLDAPESSPDIYSVGPMFAPSIHRLLRLPTLTT